MSRFTELKKQYPHLALSPIDVLQMIDTTGSNKYLQLMCNLYTKMTFPNENEIREEFYERLNKFNINTDNLKPLEIMAIIRFFDYGFQDEYEILFKFISYMESGLIENKDVTSYKNIDQIKNSISIANLKKVDKELSKQIHIEYENNEWIILRPLTHHASNKYGSETRWCTTSKHDPSSFTRYWSEGVLIYFINKLTGYKFAAYKSIKERYSDNKLSFWNQRDVRVDFLELQINEELVPIIKNILSTENTNEDLCSEELTLIVRGNDYFKGELSSEGPVGIQGHDGPEGPTGDQTTHPMVDETKSTYDEYIVTRDLGEFEMEGLDTQMEYEKERLSWKSIIDRVKTLMK